jgi:hypothetical protein
MARSAGLTRSRRRSLQKPEAWRNGERGCGTLWAAGEPFVRCPAGYCVAISRKGEWRGWARDGKLVLPAMEDDGFCFASLVLSEGNAPSLPVRSGQPGKSEAQPLGSIEIAVGQVTIRLDGATTAARIAEIVRAIGPSP